MKVFNNFCLHFFSDYFFNLDDVEEYSWWRIWAFVFIFNVFVCVQTISFPINAYLT